MDPIDLFVHTGHHHDSYFDVVGHDWNPILRQRGCFLPGETKERSFWYMNNTQSLSGPLLVTGDFNIARNTPGILNHSGGTITETTPWALLIGQFATDAYYMSGNAGVITSGGTDTRVLVGNENQATWSMTDNSTATTGQLLFNSPADDTLLLAGNATVNAEELSFTSAGNDYISLASGSAATPKPLPVGGLLTYNLPPRLAWREELRPPGRGAGLRVELNWTA